MSEGVCLITGTTHGIGLVTAREIARTGMRVVMACRDPQRGAQVRDRLIHITGNRSIELLPCDLSSQVSVRQAAAEFSSRHPRLDLLINNAGMMANRLAMSVDGIELMLATNYLGPYLLTRLLLERIIGSQPARIVNVASKVHFLGRLDPQLPSTPIRFRGIQAYAQSKQALVMFTLSLAERLAGTGVCVNCLHPGVIATNIIPDSQPWLKTAGKLVRHFMFDEERGAKTSLHLALNPDLGELSGCYFNEHQQIRPASAAANDSSSRATLWTASARLTGLEP